jgi:hypothetical protein
MDLVRTDQLGAELARPGVEATKLRGRNGVVQRVAEQLVTEVVIPAVDGLERKEDRTLDELLERSVQILDLAIHDAGEDIRGEAATHHGCGPAQSSGVVAQAGHPRKDRILDGVRDSHVANRAAV